MAPKNQLGVSDDGTSDREVWRQKTFLWAMGKRCTVDILNKNKHCIDFG